MNLLLACLIELDIIIALQHKSSINSRYPFVRVAHSELIWIAGNSANKQKAKGRPWLRIKAVLESAVVNVWTQSVTSLWKFLQRFLVNSTISQ